jgi:hypothetical protein
VTVKHVHVHAGGQAVVGNVSQRDGGGVTKNDQRPYERRRRKPTTRAIPESPPLRSANQKREALPVTSDKKGALSVAWRRKR